MRLQRKWGCLVTVFIVVAVLLVTAARLVPDSPMMSLQETYDHIQIILMFGSLLSVTAAVVLMRKHLCCPHCGALTVNPWQKRGTIHYCSQCGAALAFDDGETN